MKKGIIFSIIALVMCAAQLPAQEKDEHELKQCSNTVKQAVEVESLFPMFITGGFHAAVGYRYDRFRIRFSVINGGHYNAEKAGLNSNDDFKRFYKTSPVSFWDTTCGKIWNYTLTLNAILTKYNKLRQEYEKTYLVWIMVPVWVISSLSENHFIYNRLFICICVNVRR